MGWRERDWARRDAHELRKLYRSNAAGTPRRTSERRASAGLLLAVAVSATIYLVGHFPRTHPILPALAFHLPSFGSSNAHIATSAASYGSTFTLRGTTPNRHDGSVRVDGSWNGTPWRLLGTTATQGGTYSVSFPITEHGTLKLRARYPGGEASGTVLVP